MIVQCEHCKTKYRIPDEKVKEKGVRVRCPKCNNTFVVLPSPPVKIKPPSSFALPPEENQPDEPEETTSSPLKEAAITPPERPCETSEEPPAPPVEDTALPDEESSPEGLIPGNLPPGTPADTGPVLETRSARPAHEKDRPPEALADDKPFKLDGPEEEKFELESTRREDAPSLSEERGPSSDARPPFEAPPSPDTLEDWGNIPLDSEGEKETGEAGIGLGGEPPAFSPPSEEKVFPDLSTGFDEELPPREPLSRPAPSQQQPEKRQGRKWPAVLLVLALLGAGGYLFYKMALPKAMETLYDKGILTSEKEASEEILKPTNVAVRSLVRQDGKMIYTVQGEVRNDSSVSVGMIQVEAQFRDRSDGIVARSSSYCGNIFGDEQLISGDLEKIRRDLQNELGQSLSNSSVKPGQAVPFLVILEDPPNAVDKVTVTISGFNETT